MTCPSEYLLTKNDFMEGLSCPKRLWLRKHAPRLSKAKSDAVRERMRAGSEIGVLARNLYPDGTLAETVGLLAAEAAEVSFQLLKTHERVFEPTFVTPTRSVRVDVMRRSAPGWAIDEAKSSTVKAPEDLVRNGKVHDLAFQFSTIKQAGFNVCQARLVLVDSSYTWPGGDYHFGSLFQAVDLTEECMALSVEVDVRADQLHTMVTQGSPPEAETNTHCDGCDFYEHCHEKQHKWDVVFLPTIDRKSVRKLRSEGYSTIDLIPEDYKLSPPRRVAREVIVNGSPYLAQDIAAKVQALKLPAAFIDFESCGTALPQISGTRPYQPICFQWSAHVIDESANLKHFEFLHTDRSDPRPEFCRTLYEAVRDCRSLVHYTPYEFTRLRDMQSSGVPFAAELVELMTEGGFDLHKLIKECIYFEAFRGRSSIKVVLPVLVPHMSYKDMSIADGNAAGVAFLEIVRGDIDESGRGELVQALLEYCGQDTLAMVAIYEALRDLAGLPALTSLASA